MLIPGKFSETLANEIGYCPSILITSKLRIKVGSKRAISKTKTGKVYIIRINHNVPTEVKGAV